MIKILSGLRSGCFRSLFSSYCHTNKDQQKC